MTRSCFSVHHVCYSYLKVGVFTNIIHTMSPARVCLILLVLHVFIASHKLSAEDVPKVVRNRFPVTLRRKLSQSSNLENGQNDAGGLLPQNITGQSTSLSGGLGVPTSVSPTVAEDGDDREKVAMETQSIRHAKSIRNSPPRHSSVADYGLPGVQYVTQQPSPIASRPTPSYSRPTTENIMPTAISTTEAVGVVAVTSSPVTSKPTSTIAAIVVPTSTQSIVMASTTEFITDEDEEDEDVFSSRAGLAAPVETAGKSGGRSLFGSGRRKFGTTRAPPRLVPDASDRVGSRAMKFEDESNVVTDFVFSDIKCYRTKQREYFGASIYMKRGYHVPYIRDRPEDPLTTSDCKMEKLETPNGYRMVITDLKSCGVEPCGDSLCLTMVFPRVPSLALADDEVTTIKCQPQKSSISETRTISFAGDSIASSRISRESRRSSSTVEGGGQEFAAEVGVFRQNPGSSNGLFVKRVNSGGVVQLGEPLQLRSVVRGGDGWSFSKLSDVKVWRMRDSYGQNLEKLNPNDASEVITLVDGDGCRNAEYDVIAESHPIRDPRNNLVHHFTFRAFLFRGQRANEPLIITSKVQACQEAGECRLSDCGASRSVDPNVSRYRRSPTERHNVSSIIQDFDTQLSLRVVGLHDHPASLTENDLANPAEPGSFTCTEKMGFAAAGGGCVTLFLLGLIFSLICYSLKNQEEEEAKPNAGDSDGKTLCPGKLMPPNPLQLVRKPQPNKPLPPPPVDYDEVAIGNDVKPNRSHSEIKAEGQQLSDTMCEYESVNERKKSKGSNKEDGVVIVYCCDKGKRKTGSSSAPSSLRSKRQHRKKVDRFQERFRQGRQAADEPDDTEESDGFYTMEKVRPRTVREVKRGHQKQRRMSIRRRLSSFYREMNGSRHHRSFPARISVKNVHGGMRRGKMYYDANNNDEDNCDYSDGLSPGSSDIDSAYFGSECSKHREDKRGCGESCKRGNLGKPPPLDKSVTSAIFFQSTPEPIYGNLGLPLTPSGSPSKKPAHFVTTSDASTKIIILPETDV